MIWDRPSIFFFVPVACLMLLLGCSRGRDREKGPDWLVVTTDLPWNYSCDIRPRFETVDSCWYCRDQVVKMEIGEALPLRMKLSYELHGRMSVRIPLKYPEIPWYRHWPLCRWKFGEAMVTVWKNKIINYQISILTDDKQARAQYAVLGVCTLPDTLNIGQSAISGTRGKCGLFVVPGEQGTRKLTVRSKD
jgi:hypothetical protein